MSYLLCYKDLSLEENCEVRGTNQCPTEEKSSFVYIFVSNGPGLLCLLSCKYFFSKGQSFGIPFLQ